MPCCAAIDQCTQADGFQSAHIKWAAQSTKPSSDSRICHVQAPTKLCDSILWHGDKQFSCQLSLHPGLLHVDSTAAEVLLYVQLIMFVGDLAPNCVLPSCVQYAHECVLVALAGERKKERNMRLQGLWCPSWMSIWDP
jgi:hypothetical protein